VLDRQVSVRSFTHVTIWLSHPNPPTCQTKKYLLVSSCHHQEAEYQRINDLLFQILLWYSIGKEYSSRAHDSPRKLAILHRLLQEDSKIDQRSSLDSFQHKGEGSLAREMKLFPLLPIYSALWFCGDWVLPKPRSLMMIGG
jgi:hypothetical protein